jgi:ribosomal protein L14
MSKHETPMILWYWQKVGGILIEEFMVVPRTSGSSRRLVDGVIIKSKKNERMPIGSRPSLEGKDVIVIQAKNAKLGMNLMGQTLFSRELVMKFKPRSVISIALCSQNDEVLGSLLEAHDGCKVVVCPQGIARTG